MDLDLLNFIIPEKYKPGSDRMSKAILSNKKVVNIIVSTLIGQDAINQYSCHNTEWLCGLRSDALYCPEYPSESQPPVLIEVQNVVDKNYIHRMQQYCGNIFNKYGIDPIALTFCVKTIRNEYEQDFEESKKSVCIKMLPSKYYAKYHYIMTPTTIDNTINNEGTNTLEPMVAIQYVFSKQQRSIQGLEHQNDPTVQLLYSIAQGALSNEIRTEDETVDVLVNVCEETKKQFKRIYDALENDDNPVTKIARSYASAGFVYSAACLRKYTQEPIDSAASMPEPVSLPDGVMGQIGRSVPVLPSLPPPKTMTDMEFVEKFVEEWRKQHSQISWTVCYNQGVRKGFFKTYRDYKSLKTTYYELQRSKNQKKNN